MNIERVGGQCRATAVVGRVQWSPEHRGDRLNALAAELGLRAYVDRHSPRRWVSGDPRRVEPPVPREPWPTLVCYLSGQRLGEPVTLDRLGWARREH